jgi:2',3'-cyclic-nucleotide 2'-phosphodiesterase/3'-nucleotidase
MSGLAGVAGAGPGAGLRAGLRAGLPAGAGADLPAGPATVRLRLLATTDLHSQLLSYDYYTNRPQYGFGLAQTAALIAEARAEVPGSVLLDNGDFLQGSALADIAALPRRRRRHPAIAAFGALGYDAVALGNHEFNYGLDLLLSSLKDAPFAALSANVAWKLAADPRDDDLLAAPFALVPRDLTDARGQTRRIIVGVLGLTPAEILIWDRTKLAGRVQVRGMAEATRAWVPQIRAAGADVVVCLAHTGIGPSGPGQSGCHLAELAGIDGIDALVAGHTHQVFPPPDSAGTGPLADPAIDAATGRVAGKPVVQPGHSGSHLGIIDLVLQPGPGRWRVAEARVRAVSASEVVAGMSPSRLRTAAAPLRRVIEADHRAALGWTRQNLGTSAVPLCSHFAQVADTQLLRLIAEAKADHVRTLLAGRPEAALPVLSTARPYRCGGLGGPLNYTDIAAGPLSIRHVFDLYPFPNTLRAAFVDGRVLRHRLERSAALLRRIRPGGQDQPLVDPEVPGFSYESIPGLVYLIDPSRPAGDRILGLSFRGRPLGADDRFVLVLNSHASGEEEMPEALAAVLGESTLCTTVIADYIRRKGRLQPIPDEGWRLAPLPGTTVVHDGGAGAMARLGAVAHLRPEFLGITPAGYHRFRLHL